jgi:hypothetical protein
MSRRISTGETEYVHEKFDTGFSASNPITVAARSKAGLRHELSSLFRTLGSWVRNPLKVWMFVCAFILCLCCPVYR